VEPQAVTKTKRIAAKFEEMIAAMVAAMIAAMKSMRG
jgi:hypothetical protein